ncbi:MAG: ribonuclease T2 [Pseudomonadota bacterium]
MRRTFIALWLSLSASVVNAAGDEAGDFDYYLLALSWSPSWCEKEGDTRDAAQCDARSDLGWSLHGLWPQYLDGWPSDCPTDKADPSRSMTASMADIMGSGGLAWYQWKKHGRCSGLSAGDYFQQARNAYESVTRPDVLRQLSDPVQIDPDVIEAAFLEENSDLNPTDLVVTCSAGRIAEVRICLDKDLHARPCTGAALRSCNQDSARFPPLRSNN